MSRVGLIAKYFAIVALVFLPSGCLLFNFPFHGSFGGPITVCHDPNVVCWEYVANLHFEKDLRVPVDNLFDRVSNEDNADLNRAAEDFIAPAYQVLANKYAISLPKSFVQPYSPSKSFYFSTEWSDWSRNISFRDRPLLLQLLHISDSENSEYRWRGQIDDGRAYYSYSTPKIIHIKARMAIEIQRLVADQQKWVPIDLGPDYERNVVRLAAAVCKDLNEAYYFYIKENFELNVSQSAWGVCR